MTAYSIDYTSRVAALLLDVTNACPSLSLSWLFAVLAAVGLPCRLMNIIKVMYMDICTRLNFVGAPVGRLRCPFSGALFAIALDPFIRWCVSQPIFTSTRTFCYAGDSAIVADHLFTVRPYVSHALHVWRLASGLELKGGECVAIPAWGPPHDVQTLLDATLCFGC